MKKEDLKAELLSLCENFVQKRIKNDENAMNEAQNSANGEQKSSAGDKHETSRAMAHLEQEKAAKQLDEAIKMKRALSELKQVISTDTIDFGSLVITNHGAYYIALSLGIVQLKSENYFIVSPTSPIAMTFKGLKKGENAKFNGKTFLVEAVC